MFEKRIKNTKIKLKKEKLDGVFISAVSSISYLSGFTNFSQDEREAYIFLGENFSYIITDGRYQEAVKKEVTHLELFERGNGKSTEQLFKKHKIKSLGIEEDSLTVSEFKILKKHFKNLKHFSINRSLKSEDEIEKIKKACQLGDQAYKYALTKIKEGISEKELSFEIEFFIKKQKAELSFTTIVAFGQNSSVPHHQTGNTKLQSGDIVLLDLGTKLDGYCSDMTRTVFFGQPNKTQEKIYKTVLEAQQKAIDLLNKGERKAAKIDKIAREHIISQGYPSIPHSLGHGTGIEVHEPPVLSPKSKDILKEGMVFSIEPGIYLPGFGGVRIEDLFVLENNKLQRLTNSSNKLIVI